MPITDNKTGNSYVTYGDVLTALSPGEKGKLGNLMGYECLEKTDSDGNTVLDVDNYDKIYWADSNSDAKPSKVAVAAKFKELADDFATKAYVRNRKKEYPDWSIQFNKIYDDGLAKWKSEMIDPIKTKWPKDNSGPVE